MGARSAPELPIGATATRTERHTERHDVSTVMRRPIDTSGAPIAPTARCAPVSALGGSLDIAVEDGESDVTRERERER
jgi:hypothetical protein